MLRKPQVLGQGLQSTEGNSSSQSRSTELKSRKMLHMRNQNKVFLDTEVSIKERKKDSHMPEMKREQGQEA